MPIPKRTCEHDDCYPSSDPVNLLFRTSWNSVGAALSADGWKKPGFSNFQLPAVDQYLCDVPNAPGRKQNVQYVKPINYKSRYHVRIWSLNAESVGSAHAETATLYAGHVVMTYESGEQEVAISLSAQGWTVDRDGQSQESLREKKFDSGRMTVIDPV